MRAFGLTPEQVLAREPAPDAARFPSLPFSIIYGALSFGLVSVLAYSLWAYRLIGGTSALYAAVTAIYLGLSGVALSRLVIGPGALPRFAALFAVAFLAYALAWCACWFGLRGKYLADLWGAVAGLAALTWLVQRAFGRRDGFVLLFVVLLGFHSLGYYAGEALAAAVGRATGRLLWGAAHGLGFGAGVGALVHGCQEPLKLRLRSGAAA